VSNIRCPTLVLGGEEDPMIPILCQEDLVAALPAHFVRFERFPNCGRSVIADAPMRAFAVIRNFIEH
jgi:pimeloyl-ACP methyl ester carboxylesterase